MPVAAQVSLPMWLSSRNGGTERADALALAAALLDEDTNAMDMALRQIATWDSALAAQLESPHTPRPQAARAALAACVKRDLPDAVQLP
ncbi:hypothetical protein [Streptomyces sp. NBC_00271]|uniref:hypothetical protein n=2 Tax=Streptomyces TaxID=1883 RepID=UPI002E2B9197|nr:hypothetical protein [Streptomyces sp. NBC_00271]